ncbi:hypothetical protein V8E53_010326 [Lactarius tabidus]
MCPRNVRTCTCSTVSECVVLGKAGCLDNLLVFVSRAFLLSYIYLATVTRHFPDLSNTAAIGACIGIDACVIPLWLLLLRRRNLTFSVYPTGSSTRPGVAKGESS